MKKGSHHTKESLRKISKNRKGKPSGMKGKHWGPVGRERRIKMLIENTRKTRFKNGHKAKSGADCHLWKGGICNNKNM